MYILLFTLLLVPVLLTASPCATFSDKDFIISFWCGPPMEETIDSRYAEIRDAGFNVVMPP